MNDKIIKLLKDSGALIVGITETVKHGIKKQEGQFLGALLVHLATSIVQPVIFSIVKPISERGVKRTGRRYMDKKFLFPLHPLRNIETTNYFNYEPRVNGVFSRNNLSRIKDGAYAINLDDQ